MATVSQLCISFPYVLHGLCEDYLTCGIAFNAVMLLSHASTCGRYSRIEGVTAEETETALLAEFMSECSSWSDKEAMLASGFHEVEDIVDGEFLYFLSSSCRL